MKEVLTIAYYVVLVSMFYKIYVIYKHILKVNNEFKTNCLEQERLKSSLVNCAPEIENAPMAPQYDVQFIRYQSKQLIIAIVLIIISFWINGFVL